MRIKDLPQDRQWFARLWVCELEVIGGGRVSRGKTYANKGAVKDLAITPGRIEARVRGSRRRPYRVEVRIPVLSREAWQQIAKQARWTDATIELLQAGKMTPEVYQLLEEAARGIGRLIPCHGDMDYLCSCPDWGYPCKHAVAVICEAAARMALNPYLLFELRGIKWNHFVADMLKWHRRSATGLWQAEGAAGSVPLPIYCRTDPVKGVTLRLGEKVDPRTFWQAPTSAVQNMQFPAISLDPSSGERANRSRAGSAAQYRPAAIAYLGIPKVINWHRVFRHSLTAWYVLVRQQAEELR